VRKTESAHLIIDGRIDKKRQTNAAQKSHRPAPTETVIPRGTDVVERSGMNCNREG
jgi:hypothetical protein